MRTSRSSSPPFNNALQAPDVSSILNMTSDGGRAMMDRIVTQQATIIAYANDFKLMLVMTLLSYPLVLLIRTSRRQFADPAA